MEEVTIKPTIEPPELTEDWETDSWRHKQKLVHTGTQEKGAVTPPETDSEFPVNFQESPAEVWVGGGNPMQCLHRTF